MTEKELKYPPLIEALVEIKWKLKGKTAAGNFDPHYQLLLGTFYQSVSQTYPFHEPLPTSRIPDDVTGRMVKHRFRVAKDSWPLVQIGPGIITVNETQEYETFKNFKPKVIEAVEALYNAYPQKDDLEIESLLLRYIDAKEFDYFDDNICDFLTNQMHIESKIPDILLLKDKIEEKPVSYSLNTSFRCNTPPGTASLVISTGHKLKKRGVIWNQIFESSGADVPNMPDDFEGWIDEAHNVIYEWFEKIIEGQLKKEFNSEQKTK